MPPVFIGANQRSNGVFAKAFSGELVPTEAELARAEGRTYETADELLKRVTGEAGQVETGRGRQSATRKLSG
jgi:type I restriction enzyme S subunit